MSLPFLSIVRLERRLSTGNVEELVFAAGVNLMVGPPNTGKTKWLQTLDFLLGEPGENPFEGAEESGLAEKYEAAAVELAFGGELLRLERKWREPGAKTKIFVNDDAMPVREFQHWLMERLGIPLLNFPKGNPMSGQTWPELSFRMLLRHIYRQQRFWGDIADKQPEAEQHACLLQFLGLAERIYTDDYGQLVELRMKVEQLKSRREQFNQTLDRLARDIIDEPELSVAVNPTSVRSAQARLTDQVNDLRKRRTALLTDGSQRTISKGDRSHISRLAERRAETLEKLEETRRQLRGTNERQAELKRYRAELSNELERIARAEDAGVVLADLRITHCPACDQAVSHKADADHCFLCHQSMPNEPTIEELGAVRLRYERDRLAAELKEADELLEVVSKEASNLTATIMDTEEALGLIERELAPARQAVSAFVQEEVSALDVALGQASERERQLGRIGGALDLESALTAEIKTLEGEIAPLQERVSEMLRATDFDAAASKLEDGMNSYLNALNVLRPNVWRHSAVTVDLTRSSFTIRVGKRRWHAALGGTDTLYFLMAYHYGLLTLSPDRQTHYPGFAIIDVPGEFSGEAVEDKENFIVQPFIDLLRTDAFKGAQLIMTGSSFTGLQGAHFQRLADVHVA
jgi:predicted  nucleic acid-binding Zn-ribbon protein